MKRKTLTVLGMILGISLLAASAYFYFFSGTTVFASDPVKINAPETAVTRTIPLKENGNPHKITMDLSFDVTQEPKENDYTLFSYAAALVNDRGQVIEQNSSSYTYRVDRGEDARDPVGKHEDTITLFTLRDVTTNNYALSIIITPNKSLDRSITLRDFAYTVKSNVTVVHPALPIAGLVITLASFLLYPRTMAAKETNQTEE